MRGSLIFSILGSLAVMVLAACGGSPNSLTHSFASSSAGLRIRYPDGWSLSTANHGYVTNPALCFDISNVTAKRIVDLRFVEYLPPYLKPKDIAFYRERPTAFALSDFRTGDNDWSPGKDTSFRQHQRVFFVGLALPVTAPANTRREVLQILDSLRVSSKGRCRPTAGVGS